MDDAIIGLLSNRMVHPRVSGAPCIGDAQRDDKELFEAALRADRAAPTTLQRSHVSNVIEGWIARFDRAPPSYGYSNSLPIGPVAHVSVEDMCIVPERQPTSR